MSVHLRRLRVIATALPTYLGVVALAAPKVADLLSTVFPHGAEHPISLVLTIGSVAASVVAVIRRVSPVSGEDVGVLPPA